MGDYWGAISIGYNKSLVSNPPKTWKDLLKSDYQRQGRDEREPAQLELGDRRRASPRRSATGGSLSDVGPGIDFFAS